MTSEMEPNNVKWNKIIILLFGYFGMEMLLKKVIHFIVWEMYRMVRILLGNNKLVPLHTPKLEGVKIEVLNEIGQNME